MKIAYSSHNHAGVVLPVSELLQQLDQRLREPEPSVRRALAEILLQQIPDAMRAGLQIDELFQDLEIVANFLDQRKKNIKVKLQALGAPGHYFLLCNAPDANYIFTSIQEYLHQQAYNFRVICHPVLKIVRKNGRMTEVSATNRGAARESFVWIELKHVAESSRRGLVDDIIKIIETAMRTSRARPLMQGRLLQLVNKPCFSAYKDLCDWLCHDRFLPVAAQNFVQQKNAQISEIVDTALGVTDLLKSMLEKQASPTPLSDDVFTDRTSTTGPVVLVKSTLSNPIRHFERLTYLGLREPLPDGSVIEHGFWGFFNQTAIDEPAMNLPALAKRILKVLDELQISTDSHNYRKITEILNSFPKVELFLLSDGELTQLVRSFVQMHRQSGVKVLVAPNMSGSGLNLLLILPRSFYTAEILPRIENYLKRRFRAQAAESRNIHLSADYLSLHVGLWVEREVLNIDLLQLEHGLTRLALPWNRKFRRLLEMRTDPDSSALYNRYQYAFDEEYKARLHPRFAVRDVHNIERLLEEKRRSRFDLWGPFEAEERFFRLQYYKKTRSYLNDLMPFLENLGLVVIDEVDYLVKPHGDEVYIKSFALKVEIGRGLPFRDIKPQLLATLSALDDGLVENDYLHRLLMLTGLHWQEIDIFRAYRNYYFQLGTTFTKKRVAFALIHNPQVASLLYRYFEGRFKPIKEVNLAQREEQLIMPIRMELATALAEVKDSNEDQILRTLFNLIDATVRTGFYQRRQMDDYFISFKISSLGVMEMPLPRPMFEVYVHAATMEGIHLRGGKVARGGIRWSDRPDDFRTEVLGLMKAQMTKNAVIVPVGSKGGFIVKTPFTSREEGGVLVKDAYQHLMMGLLDLTDNQTPKGVVGPQNVVAYDEEDPYLVVAADKGTAHLSDTANAVSQSYGFWLDDAFASGGSHGYDHKVLGITARGAWEGVKRHFRELGQDIQTQPFTVVGIGDMSGDVFGNGMLLSPCIRLQAAFDHRHIFLDPDPDPSISFSERQRLFRLPRSSWDDYDRSLLSTGGGVFSRESKEIPLSPQVREWLGIRSHSIDVPSLIQRLLCAEVDLLWNGGIGTYIKASTEKHTDAGDRHNDAVRVDANQLRCKILGEGGNLGATQRGRNEYAALGGHLNTDAVDNSAGVDSSDHEVNLKILLQVLRQTRQMKTREDGYALLEEMQEEVCQRVLANNYTQTLSISLDQHRCRLDIEPHLELMDRLGRSGLLDRRDEYLPSRQEVAGRQPVQLLRPELSVLLAYSKMSLFRALIEEGIAQGPVTQNLLRDYFPVQVRERYPQYLSQHPLANEIAATMMTNYVVDRAGSSFCLKLARQTGTTQTKVAQTYLCLDHLMQAEAIRQAIFTLDNQVEAQTQYAKLLELEDVLEGFCRFALLHDLQLPQDKIGLKQSETLLGRYVDLLPEVLPPQVWAACAERRKQLEALSLPAVVAERLALMPQLELFLPLIRLVEETQLDMAVLLKLSLDVLGNLNLPRVIAGVEKVAAHDSWDRSAREALLASLHRVAFALVEKIAVESNADSRHYFQQRSQKMRTYRDLFERLTATAATNFHPYTVLLRALESLLNN